MTDDPFDPNARLAANKDALTDVKKNTLSSMISKADNLNKNGTSPARGSRRTPVAPRRTSRHRSSRPRRCEHFKNLLVARRDARRRLSSRKPRKPPLTSHIPAFPLP